jgi:hypothetical protein
VGLPRSLEMAGQSAQSVINLGSILRRRS